MDIPSPPAWSTPKEVCDQSCRRRSGYKLQLHPVSIYINKKLGLAKDNALTYLTFGLVIYAGGPEVLNQLAKAGFPDPERRHVNLASYPSITLTLHGSKLDDSAQNLTRNSRHAQHHGHSNQGGCECEIMVVEGTARMRWDLCNNNSSTTGLAA